MVHADDNAAPRSETAIIDNHSGGDSEQVAPTARTKGWSAFPTGRASPAGCALSRNISPNIQRAREAGYWETRAVPVMNVWMVQ